MVSSLFFLKNIKNTKFKEQRRVFREHLFGVLCVFKNRNLILEASGIFVIVLIMLNVIP